MSKQNKRKGFATRQIHTQKLDLPGINPINLPIFQSSTFVFESAAQGAARFTGEQEGYIYTRLSNPSSDEVARTVADLENAEGGLALASGMGAVSTCLFSALKSGDHILADEYLYSATYKLMSDVLPRYGIEASFVDLNNLDLLRENLRENTRVVYLESPTNPGLKIIDIAAVAGAVHEVNPEIHVVVDNTFCTPYLQRPLDLGADVVLHSATKYLNGHGDVIGGVLCGKIDFINRCRDVGLKLITGAVLSPFDSFLVARGLKTLDIRMEKHCKNAATIANFLHEHPKVARVNYPGLPDFPGYAVAKKQMTLPGGMISFELKTSREKTEQFVNGLQVCTLAVSLGDVQTLIEHPASMTHKLLSRQELQKADITDSLLRLSVGLEDVEDLLQDLQCQLDKVP